MFFPPRCFLRLAVSKRLNNNPPVIIPPSRGHQVIFPSWWMVVRCSSCYLVRGARRWKITKSSNSTKQVMGRSCSGLRGLWERHMLLILLWAVRNQSQPSYSLFQVAVAALSSWAILHLAVRGGGEAVVWPTSSLCGSALKSSQNQHPCICSARQRLDAAGLLAGHVAVAKCL